MMMILGVLVGGSSGTENAMAMNGNARRNFFMSTAIGLKNEFNENCSEHKKGGESPAFSHDTFIRLFRKHDVGNTQAVAKLIECSNITR